MQTSSYNVASLLGINAPRTVKDHICQLECTSTFDTLMNYIDSGFFVFLRRKFLSMCLVSETNPESKMFFKSSSKINEEQFRQLKNHFYMIHPFSEFRTLWEAFMITVYLLQLVFFIPLELIFVVRTPAIIYLPKFAFDLVCFVDVVMNFFTGYVDKATQTVELGSKTVVKQYLFGNYYVTGMFSVDVLSSIPITVIMYVTDRHDLYYLKILFFLKLFRIKTVFGFIYHYLVRRNFWTSNVNSFLLLGQFFVGMFWLCGIAVFLTNLTSVSDLNRDIENVTALIVNTCIMLIECVMLVGPDATDFDVPWQTKVLTIFFVVLGSVVNMLILSQILSVYHSRNAAQNKHRQFLQGVEQLAKYREMPPDLRDRIIAHADFNYNRKIFREARIMKTLPMFLREELMLFKCQNLVKRVEFFKNLPPNLLMQVVSKLRTEIYLRNELIFLIGSMSTCMYFISMGSVGIFSDNGKMLLTFGEGKHFGEISVLTNTVRMFTAMAISDCELLGLKRSDLGAILEPYPDLLEKLTTIASEKQDRMSLILKRLSV